MALTVLQVGYPLAPVGPDAVGGAEQVLHLCDRAVVAAGHHSLVLAPEGSQVAGELVPLPPIPERLDEDAVAAARKAAADALERLITQVDVVHMHGVDFWAYLPPPGPPLLITLHLPPSTYPRGTLPPRRPGTWLVAVSRRQRAAFAADLPLIRVDNGVDLEQHRPLDEPAGDYVVALGRICPEKGWDLAVEAARRADVPLQMAGRLYGYPEHEAWYEQRLRPLLDPHRRVVGPVSGEEKRRLLAGARCLVVPSQIPETSCLVAMEALACGTPVVAWDTGALPEVVEHGRTGLLVRDVDGLARALEQVRTLDRSACREAAARFCASITASRYVDLYRNVRCASTAPRTELVDDFDRLAELPWDDLHARSPGAGTFLRRGWLLPWAETFAPRLRCVALWRDERLDGLLPLHLQGDTLLPLGSPVSDRHGALLAGPDPFGDAAHLLGALRSLRGWTRCVLPALPPDTPLRLAPVAAEIADQTEPDEVSPALTAEEGADPWLCIPARKRRDIRRILRLLERQGRLLTWELADRETIDDALRVFSDLHAERWRERNQPGVLADPRVREHLHRACRMLHDDGVLRLHLLRIDGRPAAALLAFSEDGRLQCYLTGWSSSFARYSPISLVLARAIRLASAEGARTIDFLRGKEPYKYAWGVVDRSLYRRELHREAS